MQTRLHATGPAEQLPGVALHGIATPTPTRAAAPLIAALTDPAQCGRFDEPRWDRLIALARNARLLGVLAHRVAAATELSQLPARVQRHLNAGLLEARFRRQKALHLLHGIAPLLDGHAGPWVLLKGAAYIAQDLPVAHGRLPADVDLMVPRHALEGIERALLAAGWEFEKTDPYDQHYYRAWSHELPPMRAAGQALELDLHHAILPPLGRIRPDTASLFAAAVPLTGSPFHVLAPHDQVLHAVVHLAYDSDFVDRLRDLVDIDGLFRLLPLGDPAQRTALVERARHHGMLRPLWLATRLSQRWLGTPGCTELLHEVSAASASAPTVAWAVPVVERVLGPTPLDASDGVPRRLCGLLLEARAAWLRMPPWLVAYHATSKLLRRLRRPATGSTPTQQETP
jgi:hypothetical protein